MPEVSLPMFISYIVQIAFLMLGGYYFVISLFSFIPRKEEQPENLKYNDYALIISAHNEEQVIENLVDSLKRLDYPKDKYEIFVIADNCTDKTADIARNAGATVYERTNDKERGKGYALEWMFAKVYEMERKFDSIVIFDADNIIHKDFLKEINIKNNMGYKVVQGYIDSKNPDDSWISYSYSIAFWSVNKLFQQSRYNLKLGCQLCGTGFSVEVDTLKEMGWQSTCLTEDMEFTMRLALHDIKVAWANDAIVYDEKPITMSQSWKQRVRWMQGHADVASRFFFKLIGKSIKERKIAPFDCAIYLLQPLRIITMGAIMVMGWIQAAYPESNLVVWGLIPSWMWSVICIAQFMWLPLVLYLEKRVSKKTIWAYLTYMVYSLTWVPIAIIGVARKNNKEWFHTQHTRKISINELQ